MSEPLPDAPLRAGEKETLLAFLDRQRAVVCRKTDGLDDEQLGRRLAPSQMTLGGVLTHLAYVEDWSLTEVFLGEPAEPWHSTDWDADNDRDWHIAAELTGDQARGLFQQAVARGDRVLADHELDEPSARGSRRHDGERFSLRWIVLHLVEEYARHAGHADLLRESIDGSVGN